MNDNICRGGGDDTAAPDTEQHHRSRFDLAWLLAPIAAALAADVLMAKTLPLVMPKWATFAVAIPVSLTIWVAGTLAVIIWKARQEQEREDASGGES